MPEVECLGHWIARERVKPMTDKAESTLGAQPPPTHVNKYVVLWT